MNLPSSSTNSTHLLLFLWVLVAVGGMVWCLFIMLRPKTNQTCVVGMLIFCLAWLIECVAHSLVTLAQLSTVLLLWGVSIACVCFVAGFFTAAVGLAIHSRNEHRYQRGFTVGVLALGLNGWIVARAASVWVGGRSDELASGIVLPMFSKERFLLGLAPQHVLQNPRSTVNPARAGETARSLAGELTRLLKAQGEGDWREMPAAETSLLKSVHPAAQALLFSPQGPSWLSLSLRHEPKLSVSHLPELSEAGTARVLELATDRFRRGSHRTAIAGFECSRIRYVAVVPTLPGPHAFDHWMAIGNDWLVEMLLWSPSAETSQFDKQSLPVVTTMLRVAAEQGLSATLRPLDAENFFQRGLARWAGGDIVGAVEQWKVAAHRAPGDVEIALAIAQAQEHNERADSALEFLRNHQLLLSASPVVTAARAHLEVRAGHMARAITEYGPLFASGFSDDNSLNDYLTALSRSGDSGQAAATLEKYGSRHGMAIVLEWRSRLSKSGAEVAPTPVPEKVVSSGD